MTVNPYKVTTEVPPQHCGDDRTSSFIVSAVTVFAGILLIVVTNVFSLAQLAEHTSTTCPIWKEAGDIGVLLFVIGIFFVLFDIAVMRRDWQRSGASSQ